MRYLKWLVLLGIIACTDLTAPSGGIRLEITTEYRQWWGELETCSGFRGSIENVRFYTVPDAWQYKGVMVDGSGRWQFGSPSIITFLAGYEGDGRLVKHEMMHVMGHFSTHPTRYFSGVCGDLMRH